MIPAVLLTSIGIIISIIFLGNTFTKFNTFILLLLALIPMFIFVFVFESIYIERLHENEKSLFFLFSFIQGIFSGPLLLTLTSNKVTITIVCLSIILSRLYIELLDHLTIYLIDEM